MGAVGSGARETLEVYVNDRHDRVLSEAWPDFAELLIPARLAHLFFFDGDQIEGLTDPEHATELLASAVHSLLGLDLVERLRSDLTILDRRKSALLRNQDERIQVESLRASVKDLVTTKDALIEQRSLAQNELECRQKALSQIEAAIDCGGGSLVARKNALESEKRTLQSRHRELEALLREIAAGPFPLALVRDYLDRIRLQYGASPRR